MAIHWSSCKSRVIFLIMVLLVISIEGSNDTGPNHRIKREAETFSEEEKKQIVDLHNTFRRGAPASNMIVMQWHPDLEAEAKRYAARCEFRHPTFRIVGPFLGVGQNLFLSSAPIKSKTGIIQHWQNEIQWYNHTIFKCQQGRVCGHYTQIVWASSTHVACAIQFCDPITHAGSFNKGYLFVCEYGPLGNILGSTPFIEGEACTQCPRGYKYCDNGLCSTTKPPEPPDNKGESRHQCFSWLLASVLVLTVISWTL